MVTAVADDIELASLDTRPRLCIDLTSVARLVWGRIAADARMKARQ